MSNDPLLKCFATKIIKSKRERRDFFFFVSNADRQAENCCLYRIYRQHVNVTRQHSHDLPVRRVVRVAIDVANPRAIAPMRCAQLAAGQMRVQLRSKNMHAVGRQMRCALG